MTSVHNQQKTPAQIAEEKRLEEETAAKKKAELDSQLAGGAASGTGFFGFLGSIVEMLFKAIFSAFSDSSSEYSEIDEAHAKKTGWGENAKQKADAFVKALNNKKLEELAKKYEGHIPANTSPFAVNTEVTSIIGHRERPTAGASTDHMGLDLAPTVNDGKPVKIYNTMPGVVVRSETQYDENGKVAGFGNWVEVACIDGSRRRYAHLKQSNVAVGAVLEQGDVIGIMGNTGVGTGAHLHYEWRDLDGKLAIPEINGVHYARNDKSKHHTVVAASKVNTSENTYAGIVNKAGLPKLAVSSDAHTGLSIAPFKPVSGQRTPG